MCGLQMHLLSLFKATLGKSLDFMRFCYQIRSNYLITQDVRRNSCLSSYTQYTTTWDSSKAVSQTCSITYHNGEDDGQEGGFEDPEHSQTYDLDQCEQVYPPQRNVAEVGEVGLVFGRHHVQLNPVPEL